MTTFRASLFLLLSAFIFSSCQKELSFAEDSQAGGVGDTEIKGRWRFVGIRGVSITEVESDAGGLSSSTRMELTYFSNKATGNFEFTNDAIIQENVSYEADAETHMLAYMDGDLIMDITQPTPLVVPASSNSSSLRWVSSDSIRLTGNLLMPDQQQPGGPSLPSSIEMGARFKMKSDTLIMYVNQQTTTIPDPSSSSEMKFHITSEVLLLK